MDLLRTVANGCERLRTVADGSATSSEHTLNLQTPRVKREPLLRIREKPKSYHSFLPMMSAPRQPTAISH